MRSRGGVIVVERLDQEDRGELVNVMQTISLELAAIAAQHPSAAKQITSCRDRMTSAVVSLQVAALIQLLDEDGGGESVAW